MVGSRQSLNHNALMVKIQFSHELHRLSRRLSETVLLQGARVLWFCGFLMSAHVLYDHKSKGRDPGTLQSGSCLCHQTFNFHSWSTGKNPSYGPTNYKGSPCGPSNKRKHWWTLVIEKKQASITIYMFLTNSEVIFESKRKMKHKLTTSSDGKNINSS